MGRAFEVRKASMAKTSQAKAKLYSRFGKEIYIAAKSGEPDPEMNQQLKRLIDKAKKSQVPADVVKRAIDKAKSGVDESYDSLRYEGFGPGASTIIVDCLTDNVNRTISEVRTCFKKTKNKMGVNGSVSHMYNNVSMVCLKGINQEQTFEILIEADIDIKDIEEDNGIISVYGEPSDLYKIKSALEEANKDIEFEIDEITMIPLNYVTLSDEELENFKKLLEMLDELDDVQEVYHNVEL